jgi:hypothetical protein
MEKSPFNYYPFIILDGLEPIKYDVHKIEVSPCQQTLIVNAYYKCNCCSLKKKEQFKFYLWKMPTNTVRKYEYWLSCYERIPTSNHEVAV